MRASPRPRVAAKIDLNTLALESIQIEAQCFGVAAFQGRRRSMEDSFNIAAEINGNAQSAIFSVFDGHGGRFASEWLADRFPRLLVTERGWPEAMRLKEGAGVVDRSHEE